MRARAASGLISCAHTLEDETKKSCSLKCGRSVSASHNTRTLDLLGIVQPGKFQVLFGCGKLLPGGIGESDA